MDYWGGGAKGILPPSQIIGGPALLPPPPPPPRFLRLCSAVLVARPWGSGLSVAYFSNGHEQSWLDRDAILVSLVYFWLQRILLFRIYLSVFRCVIPGLDKITIMLLVHLYEIETNYQHSVRGNSVFSCIYHGMHKMTTPLMRLC